MGIADAVLLDRILGQLKVSSRHIDDEHAMSFCEFIEKVDGAEVRLPATIRK